MRYSFETKANKIYANKVASYAEEDAAKIIPTKFSLDVEIEEKDFIQFSGFQKNCFYNAIEYAINNKIIARTTRKSIYVVNHNMIFKDNLGEFIAKYKIKYPDGCKVDSNGKIILEH